MVDTDAKKIGARLDAAIKARDAKKVDLARLCDVSEQAVGKWVRTGEIARKHIPNLVDFLDISLTWLLTGEGSMRAEATNDTSCEYGNLPKGRYAIIPSYRIGLSAGHGASVEYEETNGGMAFRKTWLAEQHLNANDCAVVKAQGDSMAPRLQSGDVVLIDMSCTTIKDGKVYAIRFGDEVRIKRLVYRYDGALIIRSDNPDPQYRDEIVPESEIPKLEIIGRVRWSSADNW